MRGYAWRTRRGKCIEGWAYPKKNPIQEQPRSSRFEKYFTGMNNCFTEMCSGSEAGVYERLIDFVYRSVLGLRVIKVRVGHTRRLLNRNAQRLRGGLVFKAHRLCVSLNSSRESNIEEARERSSAKPTPLGERDED